MSNAIHEKLIEEFFMVFVNSVNNIISKDLDEDVCTNLEYKVDGISKIHDVESLKEQNAVYRLDYATGNRQGTLTLLIPEELISAISDILTGGNGKGSYKGSISEIETNSISSFLEKIFKSIETDFKKQYEHDLVFSANPEFLLKEMPEYSINSDVASFDFLVKTDLTLAEDLEYSIGVLLNSTILDGLMEDLGLSDSDDVHKKNEISSISVDNLSDVRINITAELGRTKVPIKCALELVKGSLIELDTVNNSDIKVYANGVEFAYAQVVAVEDNFGLKITKIISPEERLEQI